MSDAPESRTATFSVLTSGYLGRPDHRVASTVALVRDGDLTLVVDPGMVASRSVILDPLRELSVEPDAVTDVVFSHHHPDHTVNAALFLNANYHDHWAMYRDDLWVNRAAEGVHLSPSVRLIQTPGGHSNEDVSTLVGTPDGIVVFTHLWWTATVPEEDPFSPDPDALHAGRERILAVADLIVPGHGEPFTPDSTTPR